MVKSLFRAIFWSYQTCKWEAKTWFLGPILLKFNLWPLRVGQILQNVKNTFTLRKVKSLACVNFWPNRTCLIQITTQTKTWFPGQILSKFYLWPPLVRSIFQNMQYAVTGLFLGSCLLRSNFCWNRTCQIQTTSQNLIPAPAPPPVTDIAIHRGLLAWPKNHLKEARLWFHWVDFLRIFDPRFMGNISQDFIISPRSILACS